jgi:hypothetical protein
MELIERVNPIQVQYLKTWSFKDFLPYCKQSCKNDDERRKLYDKMMSFCESHIRTGCEIKRLYRYTLQTNFENGGRLFCGNSIQGLPKHIRGFLCNGIMSDIDMVNAHPTILLYLCNLHSIHAPNLEYYIQHREEILIQFDDREKAKTLFLKAVNDDKLNRKESNQFFRDFDKEMKYIQTALCNLPEYGEIVNNVPVSKLYNFYGSAINRILCVYENRILQQVLSILNYKSIEPAVLMFDGIMVYGDFYNNVLLLRDIEHYVEQQFNGLNMRFVYKPHSNDIQLPENFTLEDVEEEDENLVIACNDLEASNIIFERIKSRFRYFQGTLYFRDDCYCWSYDNSMIKSFLNMYVLNSGIYRLNKDGDTEFYVQNRRCCMNVSNIVYDTILYRCNDNNWFNHALPTSKGKLLFNNGYYDIYSKEFIHKESDTFQQTINDIIFFEKINYDYTPVEEYMKEDVRQRFFYQQLGKEQGDYLISLYSSGLAGDTPKSIVFNIGFGNTGKSIQNLAISNACDGYYGDYNAINLAYKRNQDEAQSLRWVLLLRTKRIICSNEVQSGAELDGNVIKKLSNGGYDRITARLHGGNETSFNINFLPVVSCNDIGSITPPDDALNNRLKCFSWNKIYVDEPSNEYELRKDPNIEHEIYTLQFKQTLINIFIDGYQNEIQGEPMEVIESKRNWFNVKRNGIIEDFIAEFEITNDEDDYTCSRDIQEWILRQNLKISMTKFCMDLDKYVKLNNLTNVYSKIKKVRGKTTRLWVGIKYDNTMGIDML